MRLPRIDYPGARHHVMNRGARRSNVFLDDADRALFLSLLADLPQRFACRVHAWALMPNHYHLLIESEEGRLSRAMRHIGSDFTRRLNERHGWDGPAFKGRFHNRLVSHERWWTHLLAYVHGNPVKDGYVGAPEESPWTSHAAYTGAAPAPAWLTTKELLDLHGGIDAYDAYLRGYLDGDPVGPDDFDGDSLWLPLPSRGIEVDVDLPHVDDKCLTDGFAAVCRVTGETPEALLASRRGPRGNPGALFLAWALSRKWRLDHGMIARATGTTISSVGKRIERAEARFATDPHLREWLRAFED